MYETLWPHEGLLWLSTLLTSCPFFHQSGAQPAQQAAAEVTPKPPPTAVNGNEIFV